MAKTLDADQIIVDRPTRAFNPMMDLKNGQQDDNDGNDYFASGDSDGRDIATGDGGFDDADR